ncbi:16S rRNA (guanine(1207)-N(2))-methyltransferase RsmC [Enterobacter hormaechei]|uniref:16S rRNA (guanine(1207)-N(2))-methyltransferase RsmC n=1 Tax=Enterobacter hormaechei TaxID=158836 RepID=UPI000FD9A252|nr:16S rRNA (guanine(1207)-N(2))-methyltransferase RsmC [Enterobacter hormaechei]RVS20619.1 16S rRNA (guanine(1207)-N(2))-methyltransferase RsmC [Enterobacter hormaechei]
MSAFTPASEVLLRHSDDFEESRILFAGDMQDDLPARFDCAESRAHTQYYHHWQVLSRQMGERARFSLAAEQSDIADCDTLIYYWPKNKPEAQFQLMNLLSLLPVGCDIFVVGENRSGVRSAEQMLEAWAPLTKIDSARRCGLYHGRLEKQTTFDADAFWDEYQLEGLTIKTLPGVFSRDALDTGSKLLLSTLTPHTKGKVLDVGCGAGVLSFDMIISNPPFHDGMETSLEAAQTLIRGATRHLNSGGELRIVANAFLAYPKVLDETFGFHEVIAQTGRFKVYRTVMTRQAKK